MEQEVDLFGNAIEKNVLLRDKFVEPPFSVLDTRSGSWQDRKRNWSSIGIRSEVGREKSMTYAIPTKSYSKENMAEEYYGDEAQKLNTSIFDPALCEVCYRWFCPEGGKILDPFAGGSVRGIVANYLGFKYTGLELREEQVVSNREQAKTILAADKQPVWHVGDSDKTLDTLEEKFDFVFSCPPYFDLEVYSDLPDDISNMDYPSFLEKYRSIIRKAVARLKNGAYACFVVGEVRDKRGYYIDFVGDTKTAFMDAGAGFYNDAILLNSVGSGSMRADRQFSAGKKLVKIHQNVLVFKKEEGRIFSKKPAVAVQVVQAPAEPPRDPEVEKLKEELMQKYLIEKAEKDRQKNFNDTMARISRRWDEISPALPGCLKTSNPALNDELKAAEEAVDAVWKSARLGLSTEPEFKTALLNWERKNYEAIKFLSVEVRAGKR